MTYDLIVQRKTFTIETTFAVKLHLRMLALAREAEFKITLLYFSLLSPELYLARIARRESEGEHDVAEADVRRSCDRSLVNLSAYAAQSDIWRVFDVSRKIVLVAAEGFANRAANVNTEAAVPLIVVHWVSQLPPCRES